MSWQYAFAAENLAPLNTKLYYEASYFGLIIGKAGIEINQQPEKAEATCDISTAGIVGLFLKHSSHTTLTAIGSDFTYPERKYETHYQTRNKKRSAKIIYKGAKVAEEEITPPESDGKRPAVPADIKNTAYDLLSFLLQMRKELARTRAGNLSKFTLHAYDGRRLTQADFIMQGNKTIKINGKKYVTIAATTRRTLKAGYSAGEMADYDPDEPAMTIYFSDDEKLIPLRFEIPYPVGKLTTDLEKTCADGESCLLKIQE